MFNPHIHQQQHHQQQQQFHQHLRQLQQLFQQQPPPPPPPQPQPPPGHHVPHHHQTPRALPVPPQTAPPPRMVNLCQATQTTIIAPNPMLQGAILMQQMQGNMRSFGMGGQQFRQFFTAGARSSLLGPVPMGMAMKSPMMGFPAARPFHPHARYYNNSAAAAPVPTTAPAPATAVPSAASSTAPAAATSAPTSDSATRLPDRKRDSDQLMAGSADEQPAAASSSTEASEKSLTDGAVGGADEPIVIPDDEPAVKKPRTSGEDKSKEASVAQTNADGDVSEELSSNATLVQSEDSLLDEGSTADGGTVEEVTADEARSSSAPSDSVRLSEDDPQPLPPAEESPLASPENQDEEGGAEDANRFYCYLCSITCHNQHNFRSHMNSISHQQRMMEIQHMSNACLVTLLPRVQESLQGASKDGERKSDSKRVCPTCHTHFSGSAAEHRRSLEHKLASSTNISSCAVCKKHFKTPQAFLEHLQSQEHRRKLQDKGCEALSKLAALDTEGFSLEEDEAGSEAEGSDGGRQDAWSSLKEVSVDEMTEEEQHDPDTAYGSSFLVPVAGFICGLCNKFYHFDSSALHTHCKSLTHFDNLKRYRSLLGQKPENVPSCPGESPEASSDGPPEPDVAMAPVETLPGDEEEEEEGLEVEPEEEARPEEAEPTEEEARPEEAEPTEEARPEEAEPTEEEARPEEAEPTEEARPEEAEPGANQDLNLLLEEEEAGEGQEKEAPATPGKRNGGGKAKAAPKRRSGRAANRR